MLYWQKACDEDVHMTVFVPLTEDDVHVSTAYKRKADKIKPVNLEKDSKKSQLKSLNDSRFYEKDKYSIQS